MALSWLSIPSLVVNLHFNHKQAVVQKGPKICRQSHGKLYQYPWFITPQVGAFSSKRHCVVSLGNVPVMAIWWSFRDILGFLVNIDDLAFFIHSFIQSFIYFRSNYWASSRVRHRTMPCYTIVNKTQILLLLLWGLHPMDESDVKQVRTQMHLQQIGVSTMKEVNGMVAENIK